MWGRAMAVKISQLRVHLGSALEQLWVADPRADRRFRHVTLLRGVGEAEAICEGELAVLDSALHVHDLEHLIATIAARRGIGLLVPGRFLGARETSVLRQEAAVHELSTGILSPDSDTWSVVNVLNRATAAVRVDPAAVSIRAAETLQALAQTLGRLVGNSVTIESPSHELLAFSAMEGVVDRVREETILRRSGQPAALAWVIREGYVDQILKSDEAVHVPPNPALDFDGRLARRVAYEGEPMAIIWVTSSLRCLTERDEEVITEAADAAATILRRQREAIQREAELRTEILEDIIHGRVTNSENTRAVARSIGWNIDHLRQAIVVSIDHIEAFRLRHVTESGWQLQRARERLTELVRLETAAIDSEAVIGPRTTGAIVLFTGTATDDETRKATAMRLASRIAQRFDELIPDLTVTVGVGQHVESFEHIAETVRQAELAAQLGIALWGGNRAVHYSDLGIHRALSVLRDDEEMITPALQRIIDYDEVHQSDFLHTLDVYLGCMGRLRPAAELLNIHRNTLEYRMHRIEELAGIGLEDRDNRLALELGIRLLQLRQATRELPA